MVYTSSLCSLNSNLDFKYIDLTPYKTSAVVTASVCQAYYNKNIIILSFGSININVGSANTILFELFLPNIVNLQQNIYSNFRNNVGIHAYVSSNGRIIVALGSEVTPGWTAGSIVMPIG